MISASDAAENVYLYIYICIFHPQNISQTILLSLFFVRWRWWRGGGWSSVGASVSPHSVCPEPAVRWSQCDRHQPSPGVLLWASWTGPQEGAPTSVSPGYVFFSQIVWKIAYPLHVLTHQFMLQTVAVVVVWCVWNILTINPWNVCVCAPTEPVISLVHRDYWQCFEQLLHQDACGRLTTSCSY